MFLFTTPPGRDIAPTGSVAAAVRAGAERSGTGFDYLLATAQRESALDPKARARTSSATGLFQFVEQTWLGLVKADGPKHGLGDYAKAIRDLLRRTTRPPVSVNQTCPFGAAFSSSRVPVVRKRLASM